MTNFLAAFKVESIKLRRSKALWILLLFLIFVVTLRFEAADWKSYLGDVTYIFSMLGR